jgi:hypothetical protein
MAIYVQHNSQQLGPYTVAEVRSQLASGALSIHDPVWWQGQESWLPLGSSPMLEPGFKDPGSPAPKKSVELTGRSQFSIATLVAGCLFPLAFFATVPAIVFGHCALHEFKQNPKLTGRRMALTGLALGYFWTLVWTVAVGIYFYKYNDIQAMKERDAIVHSDVLVPPVPAKAPTRPTARTNAAPVVTNLDQPMAPATAAPPDSSTNSAPAK